MEGLFCWSLDLSLVLQIRKKKVNEIPWLFIYICEVSRFQRPLETRAKLKKKYLFYLFWFNLHVCMCTMFIPGASEGQMKELELQAVVNCHVGLAIEPWSSQDQQVLLTTEQSLQFLWPNSQSVLFSRTLFPPSPYWSFCVVSTMEEAGEMWDPVSLSGTVFVKC